MNLLFFRVELERSDAGRTAAHGRLRAASERRVSPFRWIGLAIAATTGVVWFQLQAAAISGLPFGEAMTSDVLSTVLNETQFGLVSKVRLVLAVILAACLAYDRLAQAR